MHTIANVQSKKQVAALIATLEQSMPQGTCEVHKGATSVQVRDNSTGLRVMSAIGSGNKWAVKVTEAVAAQHNIPLWKDIQV
jgi:adenylosuccinate lyase